MQTTFKGSLRKYFPVRTTHLLGDLEIDDFLQQALEAADLDYLEETRRIDIIELETEHRYITLAQSR